MAGSAKVSLLTKSRRALRGIDLVTRQGRGTQVTRDWEGFPSLILIRFAMLRFSVVGSKLSVRKEQTRRGMGSVDLCRFGPVCRRRSRGV